MGYQAVEVCIGRSGDAEALLCDVVDSIIIYKETAVTVIKRVMSREYGIVGFCDCGTEFVSRIDRKLYFAFLAIINS